MTDDPETIPGLRRKTPLLQGKSGVGSLQQIDSDVQIAGEADPEKIGQQQGAGGAPDPPEQDRRDNDQQQKRQQPEKRQQVCL